MKEEITIEGRVYLSTKRASEIVGLSRKQFAKYVASGFVRPDEIKGRKYYYTEATIKDFAERKRKRAFDNYSNAVKARRGKAEK